MLFKHVLFFTVISLLFACYVVTAQTLPGVQKNPVMAPINVKIDGLATEWKFEAYNKSTSIFYTMANNNDNLYIVVQAAEASAIQKILAGGIILTIKKSADIKDKLSITYPILPSSGKAVIINKIRDPHLNTDSALITMNQQLASNSKEIGLQGFKGISDSTISIYNEYGIKAIGVLNNKKAYTCEFSIPLKYLQQTNNKLEKFNYNIKLNGYGTSPVLHTKINNVNVDPNSPQVARLLSQIAINQANKGVQDSSYPTDFSGSYTLKN